MVKSAFRLCQETWQEGRSLGSRFEDKILSFFDIHLVHFRSSDSDFHYRPPATRE